MTPVFVSAWVGAGNLGDELLFRRLQGRLRDAGADDLTVVSLDPPSTEALHGVAAIHPRNLIAASRAIRRAALVVVGPGGLLQDHSSPFNLPYQLHRAMLARPLGTPVLGMGLGADPMDRLGSGSLLRLGLGGATAVAVRDEPSRVSLERHRVTAVATADLALATPSPAPRAGSTNAGSTSLVVSLRPWRGGGRLPVRWQRHELRSEQVEATATALDEVARSLELAVRFVAFEPQTDHPLHEAIAARMTERAECVVPELDELVEVVADSRAVVATRYHAGIVALVAERPLALIGYAPKVRALAADFGGDVPIVSDDLAGLTRLPQAIRAALAVDAQQRAQGLAALREREAANAELIAGALAR